MLRPHVLRAVEEVAPNGQKTYRRVEPQVLHEVKLPPNALTQLVGRAAELATAPLRTAQIATHEPGPGERGHVWRTNDGQICQNQAVLRGSRGRGRARATCATPTP